MTQARPRLFDAVVVLLLLLAPLALVGPSVFGDSVYLPFDTGQFPPVRTAMNEAEVATYADQASNPDVTELPALVVPEMRLARQEIDGDRPPVWNPYARFGAPLYANGLAAMAYPPNAALMLTQDPEAGLGYAAWLSFGLAGVLAFALLRHLGMRGLAAALGALAFAYGSTMAVNGHFYMRMNALIWLPALILAVLRIVEASSPQRRTLPAAGLAVATAMTLLAGFPPFAVGSLLVTGLIAGAVLIRRIGRPRHALALAVWLLLGVGIGALIAGIQLVPMFEFFPESNRKLTQTLDSIRGQGFDPMGFLGYLMPTAFGFPGELPAYGQSALCYLLFSRETEAGAIVFPHNYNYTEYAVFPGTAPLLLAFLGMIGPRAKGRSLTIVLLATLFVVAMAPRALASFYGLPIVGSIPPMRYLGPASLLFAGLAAAGLQALSSDRGRFRILVVAGLAWLVAGGAWWASTQGFLADPQAVVDRLLERYRPQAPTITPEIVGMHIGGEAGLAAASERLDASLERAAMTFGIAGLWLVLVWLAGRARKTWLPPAVIALGVLGTAIELWSLAAPINANREPRPDDTNTPIHEFLREQRDAHAEDGGITIARAWRSPRGPAPKEPVDIPAGTLFPERVRDLNSYAFVDSRSHLPFRALYGPGQMIRSFWPRAFPDDQRLNRPFFDLIGARFMVGETDQPMSHAGTPVGPVVEGNGRAFRVYERDTALPRAWVVHALRVPAEEAEFSAAIDEQKEEWSHARREDSDVPMVRALVHASLDPRAAALVTPDVAEALAGHEMTASATPRRARFVDEQPNGYVIEVDDGPAGLLVVADSPMSGWSATVNGEALPIQSVNLFMRGVPLPAGAATVEFVYDPPGLRTGVILSIAGLMAMLGLILWRMLPARERPSLPPVESEPEPDAG